MLIYICIHLKIAEHCLLTISYFSVFAYFLMAIPPSCSTGTEGPTIQFVLEYIEHPARCLMGTETSAV